MKKLVHIVGNVRRGTSCWMRALQIPVSLPDDGSPARHGKIRGAGDRYRLTRLRTLIRRAARALPPVWRERAAERFLRRTGAPGPAAEHVVQYLLSAAKSKRKNRPLVEATVAKGADTFYERQYRQYLNPLMGAFAMTATQVLLASGGASRGLLWRHCRKTYATMLEGRAGAPAIMVIDFQTVAVPLLLPKPANGHERAAVGRWLGGHGAMPLSYRKLVAGEEIRCAEPHVHARERGADGAVLEVVDRVIHSKKLALLALHPHDPDAMGLHITLFAAETLEPERVAKDYGLAPSVLEPWRRAALREDRLLVFCAGGTEEIFTQCSQNLFVKRPVAGRDRRARAAWPNAWNPVLSLERLLAMQFETFQVTVSASGVPGASPRNGDSGKAAFAGRLGRKTFVLIPYYPGNAVHGHTANCGPTRMARWSSITTTAV